MNRNFARHLFAMLCFFGWVARLAAESHTTNIIDGVTTNAMGPFILGDTGPFNFLLITNAGMLTNTTGTIGNTVDAHSNVAIVTGPGSVWQNTNDLFIGATGALNQVSVLDGGRLGVGRISYLGLDAASSDNRLVVSGSNSFFSGGFIRLGDGGSRNELIVQEGAQMTASQLRIGADVSSFGNMVAFRHTRTVATVGGQPVLIGSQGPNNRLSVTEGARLSSAYVIFGLTNSSFGNRAELSGAGSLWNNGFNMAIGAGGPGNFFRISDSALLQAVNIQIGSNSMGNAAIADNGGKAFSIQLTMGVTSNASDNLFLLDGPGTVWTNRGIVTVGAVSSGNLLIVTNGAWFYQQATGNIYPLEVGFGVNSRSNAVIITGPGSLASGPANIRVGVSGSGNRLLVADGAGLISASASIGFGCTASDNLVWITGSGSVWSNSFIEVGFCSTNNSLVIADGARVLAGTVRTSVQGGSGNAISVSGPGSLLRASGNLVVGNSGSSNTLAIRDGARVEGRRDEIGLTGMQNTTRVCGLGSTWSNESLTIGDSQGFNRLFVADGAVIQSGSGNLGVGANARNNSVVISGSASAWIVRSNLIVGAFGSSNELSVLNGAQVSAGNLYLGAGSITFPAPANGGSSNRIVVTGPNSMLTVLSNVYVGYQGGANRFEILDGAQVNDQDGIIGIGSIGPRNSALVSGHGSIWNNTSNMIVGGPASTSSLVISNGGVVRNALGAVGSSGVLVGQGSICTFIFGGSSALVTDPGSLWENRGPLFVGRQSIFNTLVVSNAGRVVAGGGLLIGETSGSVEPPCGPFTNANRIVVDGGCVLATNLAHDAVLEARHGTLTLRSGLVVADTLRSTNGDLSRIELAGATLSVGHGRIGNGPPLIVGDGLHYARLHLHEPAYWGSGKFDSDAGLLVQPHAWLTGVGTLTANVTNAGTISPEGFEENALGLSVLMLLPSSVLHFDIGGRGRGTNYDSLTVTPVNWAGQLRVALRGGFVPAAGDVFQIIGSGTPVGGSFNNVSFGGRLKTTDNLGSFLVATNGNRVELRDYQSTDLDGDGIEDGWANTYFGHSPLTPAEKLADADNDGASNYDEFLAGTDPNDSASALKLSLTYGNGKATLEFPCVEGRTYRVWSSDDLQSWHEVLNPTFAYPQPGRCEWTDDGKDTGGLGAVSRFFRVTAQ